MGKFNVLIQKCHLGIMCLGLRSAGCVLGNACLHPALSVWVLCQSCWVSLWLLFLLRFVLCDNTSDSSVFGSLKDQKVTTAGKIRCCIFPAMLTSKPVVTLSFQPSLLQASEEPGKQFTRRALLKCGFRISSIGNF